MLRMLEPAVLAEHAAAIAQRLEDANKDVRRVALQVLGKLDPAVLAEHGVVIAQMLGEHAAAIVKLLGDSGQAAAKADALDALGKLSLVAAAPRLGGREAHILVGPEVVGLATPSGTTISEIALQLCVAELNIMPGSRGVPTSPLAIRPLQASKLCDPPTVLLSAVDRAAPNLKFTGLTQNLGQL